MTKYDNVWEGQHGIYKVVQNGMYGYFNSEGKQIIPFMYDWASCFTQIKLYGKRFIGAYVIKGDSKTIIDINNQNIITPLHKDFMYYIINDKLWMQNENGYNLYNRKGKKLLQSEYELVINDRFRQPKDIYLVRKENKFGAIHIDRNNIESNVLPLVFQKIGFWYSPILGTLIETSVDGKSKGLYKLDGSEVIPERYDVFHPQTPFRKAFILAENQEEHTLYDGKQQKPIISSKSYIHSQYAFYSNKKNFYYIYTAAKELLIDEDCQVIIDIDKSQHISLCHYLMKSSGGKLKFPSLKSLLRYALEVKKGNIKLTNSVARELVIYGYYCMEEILCEYALMHGFEYTRLTLHGNMKDKAKSFGSCDVVNRTISLNINLLFTSEKFIRMVVMHELLHLKIPNHSKKFYKTLNSLCGFDTQKMRKPQVVDLLDTVDTIKIIKQLQKTLFVKHYSKTATQATYIS